MRPALMGWTFPPALGSISTRPLSSKARGSSVVSTTRVRTFSWRWAGLGKKTLPSAMRCGPLVLAIVGAAPWSWPSPAYVGSAAPARVKAAAIAIKWCGLKVLIFFMLVAP